MKWSLYATGLLGVLLFLGIACAPIDPPTTTGRSASKPTPDSSPAATNSAAPPPTSMGNDPHQVRLQAAITQVRKREVRVDHGFWTVFHAILGLGPKTVTLLNPATQERVNALDYIAKGGEVRGLSFLPREHGLDVQTAGGPHEQWVAQGHQDQFAAEMAQWRVSADLKFVVNTREYRFLDFVRHTKMRASLRKKQELSWAILVIGEYLGTNLSWTNDSGEALRFEDLVRYELDQPMDGAACGGTHRLFGLSWVYHLHRQKGGEITGVWKDLADNAERHKKLARGYQNADGSFSTNFFRDRGDARDQQLRMNTTGHTLEWLALALTDAELKEEWVQRAADRLALMFLEIERSGMESGSLYHAIHGLLMYYARVYGPEWLGDLAPPMALLPKGA